MPNEAIAELVHLEDDQHRAREPMKRKSSQTDWTTTKPQHNDLTGADAEAFLQALADPPLPNERLVAALRRHRSLVG